MNEEILKKLYEGAKLVGDMPDYDQFVIDMQDDDKLSRFRNSMAEYYDIPEVDQLKSDLGIVKKKEDTESPSEDGSLDSQKSFGEQLLDQLKLGSVELGEAIASTPETLYRIASLPQNLLADALDMPGLKASPEKLGEVVGAKNKILEFYEQEGEKLSKEVELYSLENYEKQGIVESFKAGNYNDGFLQLSEGIVRSAPFSLSIMAGGAATTLPRLSAGATAVFMGPEIKDQEEKGKGELEAIGNAFTIAAAETVFSSIGSGTIGKVYKDILLKEGVDQGKEVFRRGLIEMYEAALKKYGMAAGALGEGVEEVATQVTQNMVNGLPAFQNVGDAFIQGFAGGGVYTSPITAMNAKNYVQSTIAENKVNKIIDGTDYSDVIDVIKDVQNIDDATVEVAKTKNVDKLFNRKLKSKVDSGEITKEEAEKLSANFNTTKWAVGKTDLLENVSDDSKKKIASLLIEKSDLKRKIETVDDTFLSKSDTDRLNEINKNLETLASGGTIEAQVEPTAEPTVTLTAEPTVTEPAPQTVAQALNRPATLTSLGGSVLETPIEGDLYVEGQQVVIEDEAGNITEIGNVDEISDSTLQEIGIEVAEPAVKPMTDGNLMFEDRVLLSDKKGIKRNKRGKISRVTLREQDGAFVTLRGANAEEAAYQILLREATSPEQAEFINQQLEQNDEFRKATGITQERPAADTGQPAAGNRLLNEPLPDAAAISDRFAERKGLDRGPVEVPRRLDREKSSRISKLFDELKTEPNKPKVKRAYSALAQETLEQYQELLAAGYTIEINNNEPYETSADMIVDLRDNKRMKIFSTESGFGSDQITDQQRADNPLLRDSGFKDVNGETLLVNDVFRAVHDFFGHAKLGNSFGPKGEEIAWMVHSKMFSPDARRAMTTETRGQNSWVNFSGVNDAAFVKRDEARALREQAEAETDVATKIKLLEEAKKKVDEAYAEMKFAEQKIGLLPDELVFEEEINAEVEKLSDILATPNLREQVDNAVKALSKIAPDVQFVVYETEKEYSDATGNTASGSYDPNARVVSINAAKATPSTVAHETFHAILTNLVKTDAEAKALTDKMIKAVARNADLELRQYLNEFAADYDNNIQSEEKVAELVGVLASEYRSLPENKQGVIKRWLDAIAKLVGLKSFTDSEVLSVLNTISGKIAAGEQIAFEDVNVLGDPNTIGEKMSKRFQANFTDKFTGMSFMYDKNSERFKQLEEEGFITRDRELADFDGDVILLHQPDAAFAGTVMKDGEVIVEGKGGMFYPIKFHDQGFFWASTAKGADKMANDLNKVYEQNDGRVLMALTSAPYNKLLSSTTMSNAVLDFFTSKVLDRRFKIKKNDARLAIIEAANKTVEINDRTTGLGLSIKNGETLESVLSIIKEKLAADNSRFADRKMFVETLVSNMSQIINSNDLSINQFGKVFSSSIQNKYFKGITKTGKVRISAANMTQAISEMFTEPVLKEGVDRNRGGQVYAILELNGMVESVESTDHESYPKAIKSAEGQKTVLHILKDRKNWSDVFEDFETGQKVTKERENNIYPASVGMSTQGLRLKVREQVSNVRNIVRKAKDNGISDDAILKYLRDNNLDVDEGFKVLERINKEQIRARQKAEGLFDPERNVVSRFLDNVYKTAMSGRGYRPRSMQNLSEYKDGSIEAEIRIARKNVDQIDKAIKKQDNPKEVISAIDKFMRGEQDHGVPVLMIPMVSNMRTHLDNLSKKLVESGAVPAFESRQNIINNLGSYLNRSYKVYDDKNYAKKVSDEVKQAAKNKLREIYREYAEIESLNTGVSVEIILERRVDKAIDEILNQDEANDFVMRSREGSKNLTPLEQRKDIPAEIRALMGEYGDPAMNYVRSIQKVAAIIANQNFQKQLRDSGEGVYLFTEPTGKYNVKIAGESSTSMDILAGMYTTKEIADAMSAAGLANINLGLFQPIWNFYLKNVGRVKYTKTILSLGTHAKNIIGNIPFMLMTGNFNFKALNEAVQVIRSEYGKNGKPELLAKMDEYTRLGIINQSTTLNEIRDLLSSGKTFEDVMIDRLSDKPQSKFLKFVKSIGRKAEKAYQVEDDFFKIAAYESEKAKRAKFVYKKSINQLTDAELKQLSEEAATIVKNVLPNYGRVGGYVKFLKAVPIAGTFISFTSESVRTSYNTLELTFKEIADPRTRAIGINRLSGIMALAAVKAGIAVLWGLSSDDEEEDENVRKFLPFWDKNSTIVPTEIKDGRLKYRSISASDPHGYMSKVVNAYLNAGGSREGLINALSEAAEPWTNKDILFNTIDGLRNNRDNNGRPIFKEGDTSEEIAQKIMARLWKVAEPGTITSAVKIAKSENPGNETLGQFTGFKEHEIDVLQTLGYLSSDLRKRANEAGSDYGKAKGQYSRGEITVEELRSRYNVANEKKKEVYREAIDLYNGALYLSTDPKETQQRMMDWGIPRYIMRGILVGEIPDMEF